MDEETPVENKISPYNPRNKALALSNEQKARICEAFVSGVAIKDIPKVCDVGSFRVHKVLTKCLFGVPQSDDTVTLVLQSKINENV